MLNRGPSCYHSRRQGPSPGSYSRILISKEVDTHLLSLEHPF